MTERMSTASHVTARFLVDHARRAGAGEAALAELGVTAAALTRPGRLPIDRMYRAWSAVVCRTGDPAAGVRSAQRWTLDDLGLFGFCVATAPTLSDALATATAYSGLVTDSGAWRIERSGPDLRLIWSRSAPRVDGVALSNEVMVSATLRCIREMFPRVQVRVAWRHRPWHTRSAHAAVLGCEVEFGADQDSIGLAAAELDAVPRRANRTLWRYLCALADGEIAHLQTPSVVERTRGAIAEALDRHGGRPDAAALARSLGTSERSLRRHLAAEGATIRGLIGQVCLERGAALLERRASITEVALDAGFSDASAFARAWRRRHGLAPSARRRGA